ncbi:MAG: hypothetical protein HYY84_19580 [Deltaproteobacteria bacterium]|nr:hypothetical protein [Deltaproteobacteria bacterium]
MNPSLWDRLRERTGVDVGWIERRVFESMRGYIHLLDKPLPLSLSRARSLRFPLWTCRTRLFETEHHDRVVVSRVRALPMIDGVTISMRPRSGAAPWFLSDLFCFPARVSANAWMVGPATLGDLGALTDILAGHESLPAPDWLAPLASGEGFSVRARPAEAETVFRAVRTLLVRTLVTLNTRSLPRVDGEKVRDHARSLAERAPFGKRLRRVFGRSFAMRYSELLFGGFK